MLQVRQAEDELRLIGKKRQHYIDLATSISVHLTGMPGGGRGNSRVEAGAIGLADLQSMLTEKEKEYTAIVKKGEDLIAKIPQENFRKILTLRYIIGCSWKTIQDEMDYKNEKSATNCHGYALKALQKVM
jgi:hypothetical protein